MRTLQELVGTVEQLKADNAELKARFNAHTHTVTTTTTATAGDGSATATSTAGTPK